ncbi:MAG TPA: NAD(P)-dependent oxidoreductase [Pseudonocardiaceae bacterium]|jgi:nucleoside-diphosphate-sugar epimerase|nr:NAD(P)-dependent oxidoreductase [Pseudonocardiaceae bacterium]
MRVFVTGGTGAIGRHTVPALVAAGHEVTALARGPAKAAALAAQGASPIQLSLFDTDALTKAFARHDAVVNLASALPSMTRFVSAKAWAHSNEVRIKGSTSVVDAMLAAEVPVLVQESVAMLYKSQGNAWIDETMPVDDYPITKGNHAAEANAQRFTEAGGTGIILRFGLFYGQGAAHSEQMLAQAKWHIAMMAGPADGYQSSIHVRDGGAAITSVLNAEAGIYNVVDDEPLTKRDFADALADAVHTRAWLRPPGRAALLFGDRLTSLTRSLRVSNGKIRIATGWTPRYPSAREGLVATVAALRLA